MSQAIRSIRKLPFVASALILVVAGVSYWLFFNRQLGYVEARNARLLAVPERRLATLRAGRGDVERTLSRAGSMLKVEVRKAGAGPRKSDRPSAQFLMPMKDLLLQVPLGLEAFDLLLVADEKGEVIENVGDETLVRRTLEGIASEGGKPVPTAEFWKSTQLLGSKLNGRGYSLFCHPVALEHTVAAPGDPRDSTREGFIFCGLASTDRMRREAQAISPLIVVGLMGLVVLTLLTPPFIKLFLLGRSERLRFVDVYALALCGALALVMLCVAILDYSSFSALQAYGDDALKEVAVDVRTNLKTELDRIRVQLARLDAQAVGTRATPRCQNVLALQGAAAAGCDSLRLDGPEGLKYPYFESVTWADLNGEQTARWSVGMRAIHLFPVRSREYFKAVSEDNLWPVSRSRHSTTSERAGRYFVQALRSMSSDQTRAVLSIPSIGMGKPLVAAMTTNLMSVVDPLLPPGVGFALIERSGDVQFHSDSTLSLTHNLFTETGRNGDLRTAVEAGKEAFVAGRYWGQRHRFYTTPTLDIPWTVVAFRREDMLRAANVEILESAACLALLYALCSWVVPSLVYLGFMKRRLTWLWPSPDRAAVYFELTAVFSALAVLFAGAMWDARPERAVALAFVLPWVALAALVVAFRASALGKLTALFGAPARARVEAWIRHFFVPAHHVASLLLLTLVALLPAMAITKGVVERELLALVQQEHQFFERAEVRRARSVEKFYGKPLVPRQPNDEILLDRRRAESLDTYRTRLFTPKPGKAKESRLSTWFAADIRVRSGESWLGRWLEVVRAGKLLLDPAAAELRLFPLLETVHWTMSADDRGLAAGQPPPESGATVVGPWPSFGTMVGPWPLLGVLLLLVPTAVWLRWCHRRLLLADVVPPEARRLEELKDDSILNALCLVPSSLEVDRVIEGGWCQRAAILTGTRPESVDASRPLVIDLQGFEAAEQPAREATLEYAEARVSSRDQRTYLIACAHPAEQFHECTTANGAGPSAWPAAEVGRWLRLFDQLESVVLRDRRGGASTDPDDGREERSARRLLGRSATVGRVRRLSAELASAPHLRWLADHRLPPSAFAGASRAEILRQLAEVAGSYYWGLWGACSANERLALVQLAEESFVNPKQVSSVRRLLDRGLVVKHPMLCLINESFALFVREKGGHRELTAMEKPGDGVSWADLQLPLVTIAAVCGLFLLLSHQEMLDASMPVISALGATGVPFLMKMAAAFKSVTAARVTNGAERA